MTGIGSPITKVIEETRKQIEAGKGDWELKNPVEFEISAIISGNVGGGLDIQVVNFGTKVEAEQVHKVKFTIGPKDEAEEAEKKARKAIAEKKEKLATSGPSVFCA